MRRHEALVPLSHDHHDGLLLAVRLQQGPRALLRLWSHDPSWQAEYVIRFFEEHLTPHFSAEEQFLFPAATKYLPEHSALIERLLAEHKEMRELIEFFRHPEEKKLECNLTQFGKLLEDHIHAEERELFPLCEQRIPESEWGALNEQLAKGKP
ncbi:MAG TPA: hemerythrin domain-containing protein [Bacteroidota bacterium]|nr:hemerythrin domain-containing protein [Bacteroidota bacterium]